MITPAFEGLLIFERERQRMSDNGLAVPAFQERPVEHTDAPFIVTNMRGSFLLSRPTREGYLRFGFTNCPVDTEGTLLTAMFRQLRAISQDSGWENRCSSLAQAHKLMVRQGQEPRVVLISRTTLSQACGEEITAEDASKIVLAQGYMAEVDGIRVLPADLPLGCAILATHPALVGTYTRVGDYVGIALRKADQRLVLVSDGGLDR